MGGVNPVSPAAAPDWLAALAPDRAPPPPGWWPPAPGWWILIGLVAAALVGTAIWFWWHRRSGRSLRGAALRELRRLEGGSDAELAAGVEHLLRRYAIARHGRSAVAGLSGAVWLEFLAREGPPEQAVLWRGDGGRALLQAAYGGGVSEHMGGSGRASWITAARAFVNWKPPRAKRQDRQERQQPPPEPSR